MLRVKRKWYGHGARGVNMVFATAIVSLPGASPNLFCLQEFKNDGRPPPKKLKKMIEIDADLKS